MSHISKVAAVHAAPVFLDRQATVEKALALIAEAARNGAGLIAFPEAFIPAFPIWAALWAPIDNHDLFARIADQSVLVDGPEVHALRRAAARFGICISIGISERSPASVGTLFNSNLIIGADGAVLVHHRKLVPTFYEKLVWASGDGAGLAVAETQVGRVGCLICGENTNPLARYTLMAQGEQIHVSSWPPVWPTRRPQQGGNFNNVAANRIRTIAHAFEAKCFAVATAGFLDQATRDFLVARDRAVAAVIDNVSKAETFFVGPTGDLIGDLLQAEEGIAYASFDLDLCVEPKQFHDVVGYYNRFDVFDLRVTRRRHEPIHFVERGAGKPEAADEPAAESVPAAQPGLSDGFR